MYNIILIISCVNLVLILLVIKYLIFNHKIEPMADVKIPPESIHNITSLYNGNTLVVDNLKVTGKITTNDLDTKHKITTKDFQASEGFYGRFFALNGTQTWGENLNVDGVFCKRGPSACMVVNGNLSVLEKRNTVNPKTGQNVHWIDIKPGTQKLNVDGHDVHFHRIAPYNHIAGIIVTAAASGYDDYGTNIILIKGGKYEYSDGPRRISMVHLFPGWKVIINGGGKKWTFENKTQPVVKSFNNIFYKNNDNQGIYAYTCEATWVGL